MTTQEGVNMNPDNGGAEPTQLNLDPADLRLYLRTLAILVFFVVFAA